MPATADPAPRIEGASSRLRDALGANLTPADLTIAESALRLGVTTRTIRRYIARGDLPARRIGPRLIRIRVADLDAYGSPLGADR